MSVHRPSELVGKTAAEVKAALGKPGHLLAQQVAGRKMKPPAVIEKLVA